MATEERTVNIRKSDKDTLRAIADQEGYHPGTILRKYLSAYAKGGAGVVKPERRIARTNIRLEPEEWTALKQRAKLEGVIVAEVIEQIIEELKSDPRSKGRGSLDPRKRITSVPKNGDS